MNNSSNTNLAITGASGFIGRGLMESLAEDGFSGIGISRQGKPAWAGKDWNWATVRSYTDTPALCEALAGAGCVVHLADNPERGTGRSGDQALEMADALMEAMQRTGICRAVVASSVYARTERSPSSATYGRVKRAVEDRFLSVPDLAAVILRLPPVYGPGGRGGFATLARLSRKGIPLPLGLARAPRAYLSRRNLASLIGCMLKADAARWSAAAGRRFEPSDGERVATRDLVRMMGSQTGRPTRLLPVPVSLLRAVGVLARRNEMIRGAVDALEVADPVELLEAFGWRPIERMPESLAFLREEVSPS